MLHATCLTANLPRTLTEFPPPRLPTLSAQAPLRAPLLQTRTLN
jgi:hypothetical protein